jgi:hypothetical protein
MSCVLRILGKDLNIDDFILHSGIIPYKKWYKGSPQLQSKSDGKLHEHSGCAVEISKAEFNEFQQQLKDAVIFLRSNESQLSYITTTPTIEYAVLDFGVNYEINKFNQTHYFPTDFLMELSQLNIGLEVTVYGTDD